MLTRILEPKVDAVYTLVRIVAGRMSAFHGLQILFGVLTDFLPPIGTQGWFGGIIELVTGMAVAAGAGGVSIGGEPGQPARRRVDDATSGPLRLSFNPQLRVEFRAATVTSDAGLLLPRELDERLGLDALIERHRMNPRTGDNRQFPLPDLFRQSIYNRLASYEDTNDAERLAEDPTFRMPASRERRETDVLTEERNYQGLARLNTALIQHASARSSNRRATASRPSSARATSTVRTGGTTCSSPSLTSPTRRGRPSSSARTRRLPCPPSTRHWNAGGEVRDPPAGQ